MHAQRRRTTPANLDQLQGNLAREAPAVNQTVTRAATWAVGFAYAAAWGIAGWLWTGPRNDLDYFFVPAARIALSGHPFQVYTVRINELIANDNRPLGLVPLMPLATVLSGSASLHHTPLLPILFLPTT